MSTSLVDRRIARIQAQVETLPDLSQCVLVRMGTSDGWASYAIVSLETLVVEGPWLSLQELEADGERVFASVEHLGEVLASQAGGA